MSVGGRGKTATDLKREEEEENDAIKGVPKPTTLPCGRWPSGEVWGYVVSFTNFLLIRIFSPRHQVSTRAGGQGLNLGEFVPF